MSDRTPKQFIEDVEQHLADWKDGKGYRRYRYPFYDQAMVDDLRALLEITKTALEPNVTIDLIHDPDGAIQRLTVTASSVRIETYGDVRIDPIDDSPPPRGHGMVDVTSPSEMAMCTSGDVSVITDQPYTWEVIKPERGAIREHS